MLARKTIQTEEYSYTGFTYNGIPHKFGIFTYKNGDVYIGECLLGYFDGYGKYKYKDGSEYCGFFAYDRMDGIGTFENEEIITKGSWRHDMKHGRFTTTEKNTHETYYILYIDDKMVHKQKRQYVPPEHLKTSQKIKKVNKKKKINASNKSENKCSICYVAHPNATINNCGHVSACYECLSQCNKCPICNSPVDNIIKLYFTQK